MEQQAIPEGYIEAMATRFPQEAEGIRRFVNDMLAVHTEAESYGAKSAFYKKYLKLIFPLLYPTMWKMRSMTLGDLLAGHVQSKEARHLLSFLWGYYGLPPAKLSAFYYAIATGEYLKNGSCYIKDRSQRLSDLLAETIIRRAEQDLIPGLRSMIDVPDSLTGQPLVPLLLQPIVENALLHGLSPKIDGGYIQLIAAAEGSLLKIEISDTGNGMAAHQQPGVGLANARNLCRSRQRRSGAIGSKDLPPPYCLLGYPNAGTYRITGRRTNRRILSHRFCDRL